MRKTLLAIMFLVSCGDLQGGDAYDPIPNGLDDLECYVDLDYGCATEIMLSLAGGIEHMADVATSDAAFALCYGAGDRSVCITYGPGEHYPSDACAAGTCCIKDGGPCISALYYRHAVP